MKRCPTCGIEKPKDEFSKTKRTKDGLCYQCKACHKERMAKTRAKFQAKPRTSYPTIKKCSHCGIMKSSLEFSLNRCLSDGLMNQCKQCETAKRKAQEEHYKNTYNSLPARSGTKKCAHCQQWLGIEMFSIARTRKDGLNPVCRDCNSSYISKWKEANPRETMLKQAQSGARQRGLEFSLSVADIVIPTHCPIFGFEMKPGGKRSTSPSIDRIDNSKGYIPGNIVVVSVKANHVKSDCTIAELKRMVEFYEKL